MHEKDIVHRDIKPENFAVGCKKTANVIYIIDYGLSKRYFDRNT